MPQLRITGQPEPVQRGLFEGRHDGQAVLILQCAGDITIEGATAEDSAEGYLTGSAYNAAIVRDFYLTRGVRNADCESWDFSTNQGDTEPREVIMAFLQKHRGKPRNIYYCGHGYSDGGWAIHLFGKGEDRTITIQDMETMFKSAPRGILNVYIQACFSGNWCYTKDFRVTASAKPDECSKCGPQGSKVTRYLYHVDTPNLFHYLQLGSQPVRNFIEVGQNAVPQQVWWFPSSS